ncbi:MAG: ATP-dependent Clp protease proteolytic subunit [Chloroflexota bacterium]|nr:ATP-dependent Clp protease proteolytic subunit [Chloroflexota bacterium]
MFVSPKGIYGIAPTVIEKTPKGENAVNVYTRLLKERIIWLGSEINAEVANIVMAQLLFLEHEDENEEIYMYINSPGGSVDAGMGIYDTMQFVQPDIVTLCAGGSYSMATVLLAAGAKGKRYALPNAVIHMHPLGQDISGYGPDVQIKAQHLKNVETRIYQILASHTGQPAPKIESDFQRDRYFTSQEALNYGFIDEIITRSPALG